MTSPITPAPRRICAMILSLSLGGMADSPPALAMTRAEAHAAYDAAETLRDTDASAAFEAMAELSQAGDGRATSRLAYYSLRGIGTEADLVRAEALYGLAMEQGHARSTLSRAKVLMMQGKGEEAETFFGDALTQEIRGAQAELATAHALARLGTASRPQEGWNELRALAEAGDPLAELSILRVGARLKRAAMPDDRDLLTRVLARAEEGDGRAAEALLPYLRGPGRSASDAAALRSALIVHPGVRPRVAVAERLHLAAELEPARFWRAAEKIVSEAPEVARARALVVTAQINRNAYLWVAEPYLEDHGFRLSGRRGYLNRSQIRALNALCQSVSPSAECAAGPLRSTSIKSVANALF